MRKKRSFIIEVCRPMYPTKLPMMFNVHDGRTFQIDQCSPGLTALLHVEGCSTKHTAIALALEYAAGAYRGDMVRPLLPRKVAA